MPKKIQFTQDEIKRAKQAYQTDAELNAESRSKIEGVKVEELSKIDSPKKAYDHTCERIAQVRSIIDSNGFDRKSGQFVRMSDALTHYDMPIILPKVIDEMLIEPIEPLLSITSAFTTISGSNVDDIMAQWPAMGSIEAEDMAIGQEYPERYLEMEGGLTVKQVGKVGVATKIAQESIAESRWDLVALNAREMGRALARKKEKKSAEVLLATGQVVFDNYDSTNSVFGHTTGFGVNAAYNGSITGDDLFKAWGHSAAQGFPFSVMFVHPLAWAIFVRDPLTRQFALNGMASYYGQWSGNIAGQNPMFGMNGLLLAGGNDYSTLASNSATFINQTATSVGQVPSYFPVPLSIVPTPFMPYNAVGNLTDIVAVNPGNVGVIVQKEGPTTGSWEDPARDILKMKASEKYGYGVANAGLGVYHFKGVKVDPNSLSLAPQMELNPAAVPSGTWTDFPN